MENLHRHLAVLWETAAFVREVDPSTLEGWYIHIYTGTFTYNYNGRGFKSKTEVLRAGWLSHWGDFSSGLSFIWGATVHHSQFTELRAHQIFTKKSWGHVICMSSLKDALVHGSQNGISTNSNKECHKMRNRPWSEKENNNNIQLKKIPRNNVITMYTFYTKSQIVLNFTIWNRTRPRVPVQNQQRS